MFEKCIDVVFSGIHVMLLGDNCETVIELYDGLFEFNTR
ncbi:hypothetical protein PMAG_a2103 [Pseudoalteromonas mariniglutinosa NCIMB 1770]|nr:hypothetical protein [Pseudoalteromonas mariniglutinosa NCIMB 1770]